MKKRIKKRRFYLIRPAEALLPMAFLAGELFGPPILRGWLFAEWFAVRLLALFSADGVRMAYATQPGMRKVRGSTTLAVLLQIMGALLAGGLYALVFHGITPFTMAVIGIGLVLNIEHVFCEYLRAEGDGYGAEMCSVLTAVFLFAGIMLERPGIPVITLCLSAAGCLISVLLAAFTGGYKPGKMNVSLIKHAPRAVFSGILYPVIVMGALYAVKGLLGETLTIGETETLWAEKGLLAGFFTGLAVIRVMATPFRRSALECRAMWPAMGLIAVVCAAVGICAFSIPAVPGYMAAALLCVCANIFIAAIVVMVMWGSFRKAE